MTLILHAIDRRRAAVRRLGLCLLALAGALTLVACETTEGAGRDLENLGENIQDAAE
jgi:predicted small secreted protein